MPISDCEVRDPRIRRTRQSLQVALRKLLKIKNIDEISVQDITDEATVNRATFYDHYSDKYGLLDAMVASGFHMMLHERNVCFDNTCPTAAGAIIRATCDYLDLTHTADCTRNNAFEPLIEAAIVSAIRRVIASGMTNGAPTGTTLSPDIIATAASWAIYGAVKQWFYTPNRPPSSEIVQPILELVLPILQAAGPVETHGASVA